MPNDESTRVQRELNLSTLRTAVKLFDRMQLQPSDGTISEDSSDVVSRLFIHHTNFLLKVWEYGRSDIVVSVTLLRIDVPTDDCLSDSR